MPSHKYVPSPAPEPATPVVPEKIIPDAATIRGILKTAFGEQNVELSRENTIVVGDWLDKANAAEFNLATVRSALIVLLHEGKLTRMPPALPSPPPAPPQPVAPVEILAPGEISIYADQYTLENATPSQLRSYLKRARAAKGNNQ